MKNVLIMTATIAPPANAALLSRVDVEARKSDYLAALGFYRGLLEDGTLDQVVFVDNSDQDLTFLKTSFADSRIEYISYFGLDYPPESGRGYGEFKLLDHAMKHSSFIQSAQDGARYFKITGRYILRNMASLIRHFNRNPRWDFYCNCRNHPQRWADMYFLGWTYRYYVDHIQGLYASFDMVKTGKNAEEVFREVIEQQSSPPVAKRFNQAPDLIGTRGFDNQPYQDGRLKQIVRGFAYRFLPFLWI